MLQRTATQRYPSNTSNSQCYEPRKKCPLSLSTHVETLGITPFGEVP